MRDREYSHRALFLFPPGFRVEAKALQILSGLPRELPGAGSSSPGRERQRLSFGLWRVSQHLFGHCCHGNCLPGLRGRYFLWTFLLLPLRTAVLGHLIFPSTSFLAVVPVPATIANGTATTRRTPVSPAALTLIFGQKSSSSRLSVQPLLFSR